VMKSRGTSCGDVVQRVPTLPPEFDRFSRPGSEFHWQISPLCGYAKGRVCVGAGATLPMGGGGGIPGCFILLDAAGPGSVTCQRSPFGVNKFASFNCLRSSRRFRCPRGHPRSSPIPPPRSGRGDREVQGRARLRADRQCPPHPPPPEGEVGPSQARPQRSEQAREPGLQFGMARTTPRIPAPPPAPPGPAPRALPPGRCVPCGGSLDRSGPIHPAGARTRGSHRTRAR